MKDAHAFLVGIDRYDMAGWDLAHDKSPGYFACEIAKWLLEMEVPAERIHIFLSARTAAVPPPEIVNVREATYIQIDNFVRTELKNNVPANSKLLFYWSGHGARTPDDQRAGFCQDYQGDTTNSALSLSDRIFNFDEFRAIAASKDFAVFSEQLLLIDTCAIDIPYAIDIHRRPTGSSGNAKQSTCFAALKGVYSKQSFFSTQALALLREEKVWVAPESFAEKILTRLQDSEQPPFIYTSAGRLSERSTPLGRAVISSHPLSHQLNTLIEAQPIDPAMLRRCYLRSIPDNSTQRYLAETTITGMTRELLAIQNTSAAMAISEPIAEFLFRLARQPGAQPSLLAWLNNPSNIPPAIALQLRSRLDDEEGTVILAIDLEDGTSQNRPGEIVALTSSLFTADFTRELGFTAPRVEIATPEAVHTEILQLIARAANFLPSSARELQIHLMVSHEAANNCVHELEDEESFQLGHRYPLVLRWRERHYHEAKFNGVVWKSKSQKLSSLAPKALKLFNAASLASLPEFGKQFNDVEALLILDFPIASSRSGVAKLVEEKKRLRQALFYGYPYIVWLEKEHAVAPGEKTYAQKIQSWLDECASLDEFPAKLRRDRSQYDSFATGTSIFWDEYQRRPHFKLRNVGT